MKKDTIVFINRFPLGKLFEENIEFNRFEKAGYQLVYLDLSPYYYPETYEKFGSANKEYVVNKEWFLKCQTKELVLECIKRYSRLAWFYVLHRQVSYQIDEMWLYRAFKKYKCDYILQDFLPVPVGSIGQEQDLRLVRYFFGKTLRTFSSFRFKHLLERGGSWFSTFLMGRDIYFQQPAYCFASGNKSYNLFKRFFPKSRIIRIPSIDYFKYHRMISNLGSRRSDKMPLYDYLLYIDQSVFDSPDAKLVGVHMISKDVFFKKINRFFYQLEKVTGKRLVIAATSRYRYKGAEYGGRDIIYDRTAELTYYANLVIVHSSAALNYAVVMHKPLLFLKMNDFDNYVVKNIKTFAALLHKKVIDSDENFDMAKLNEISMVSHEVYDCYVSNYITHEPFEMSPAEIVIATLKENGI